MKLPSSFQKVICTAFTERQETHVSSLAPQLLFTQMCLCYDASGAFDSSGGDTVISNTILHGARIYSDVSSSNFIGTAKSLLIYCFPDNS
jgi:hypothetical protein